ncbi:hypothetical protein [Streptomyces sp. SGAir0957]
MPEVDELLDDSTVRLPDAATVRARGDRRTVRRRLAAGLTTAAVVAAAWTAWPGPGRPEVRPTDRPAVTETPAPPRATGFPTDTPYTRHGVSTSGNAELMPGYRTWHWRNTHGTLKKNRWPLARTVCGATGLDAEKW